MVDFPVVPRKLALLNVDLQNVFVEGSPIAAPDGLAVVDRVNRLSAACRRAGVFVVHTAHVTRPDGSNVGVMGEIIAPVREGRPRRAATSMPSVGRVGMPMCHSGRCARRQSTLMQPEPARE